MAFCINCGQKLSDDAKFCASCGTAVLQEKIEHHNTRNAVFEGSLHKCPNCGEVLQSFVANCPLCGYELRGTDASHSVKELSAQLMSASSDAQRIDLIRTFPISNTREDILEFMILAATNIKNSYQVDISEAWSVKFAQAYEKSQVLFGELPEFTRCNNVFLHNREENSKSIKYRERLEKKKSRSHERRERRRENRKLSSELFRNNPALLISFAGVAFIILIIGIVVISHKVKVLQLDRLIIQVQDAIEVGDFDTARIKATQIIDDSNWSEESKEKYDDVRNSLMETIEQEEVARGSKIYIGASIEDFKGQVYTDVIAELQEKGFHNIQTIPLEDLVIGWLISDGEVEEVLVGGESDYDEKSAYSADVEIVISYHILK